MAQEAARRGDLGAGGGRWHREELARGDAVGARGRAGEGRGHRLDGLEALVGVDGHRLADDRVQVAGHPRPQGPGRDGGGRVGARGPAGEHLVQAGPEPVDVGPAVGVVAPDHLGSQVAVDPEDLPGAARVVLGGRPGDREVGHLHGAVVGEQDVARLEAAVADPGLVGVVEGGGHLHGEPGRPRRRQRAVAPKGLAKGRPVDQLHHDVGDVPLLAGVVEGDDVGVGQAGGVDRLLVEAGPEARVGGQLGVEHLDDDVPSEDTVVPTPDARHAARCDLLAELVSLGEQTGQTGADLRHAHIRRAGRWTPGIATPEV